MEKYIAEELAADAYTYFMNTSDVTDRNAFTECNLRRYWGFSPPVVEEIEEIANCTCFNGETDTKEDVIEELERQFLVIEA